MSNRSRFVIVAVTIVVAVTALLAQPDNPHVGAWKSNVAKSKFAAGTASNTSTTKIEAVGQGIHVTVDTDYADGAKAHWSFTATYDGKDSPITGNSPYGETVALTKIDAHTSRSVYKHNGQVTATQTAVVSADGKTRTVTTKGKNIKGQVLDNVNVYDRT